MTGEKEVDSLYLKHRGDPTSPYWKKKYTLLLKKAENVEKVTFFNYPFTYLNF